MTSDTEPMQRVDLVPPPIPPLPTHRARRQLERAGAPPRLARGTTPPPFVVPASLLYTEVPPSATWGTVEEIVLLDRPRARPDEAAPAPHELATIAPRRRPVVAILAAALVATTGAIAIVALLAQGDDAAVADAPFAATTASAPATPPAATATPEPAPIVVPISEDADDVDFEMEPEAVEISDIDARILDLMESGELPDEPATITAARATPAKARAAAGAPARLRKGIVMLGAKPPCRIVIDGRDTGLMTPQRDLRIPIGSHEITLINEEHGIRETVEVEVRAGKASRIVRDFSKRLRGARAVF